MTTPLSESLPQTGSFAGAETALPHAPDDMRGALPGEGPLRIDLYKVPSDTPFKAKLLRALWGLFQIPFWPHTPNALSPLRIALLKLFGAEIGPACLVNAGVRIWVPWNLQMGERSTIGANVEIQNFAPVVIGRHVVISQRNYINTSAHDPSHKYFRLVSQPITIGSQSWIASECVIGLGAQIGEGAVISAGSVVSKPMPPWMICAGNPCRPLVERVIHDVENEEPAGA
ncbi:MAG TPA: DapH/DapD/GlmU-related protein [Acidobacteriaceae bacterium]|nr:DapH/DapD/GlmU-related protein [Acidobacteriaceae bacterium]